MPATWLSHAGWPKTCISFDWCEHCKHAEVRSSGRRVDIDIFSDDKQIGGNGFNLVNDIGEVA
jgi:hypothetical protein